MDLRDVKNAHFWQIDHKLKRIAEEDGVLVLPSPKAWAEFSWSRKFFGKKPKEGYFFWVKSQLSKPLTTCIAIASPGVSQDLDNLTVVESGVKVEVNMVCEALTKSLGGSHSSRGKMVLKKSASMIYSHSHNWGDKDLVNLEYKFILERGARLSYSYRNLLPPKDLRIKTEILAEEESSVDSELTINAKKTKVSLKESLLLRGDNSQGTLKLRVVAGESSDIRAESSITALAECKGHLDCQGLLTDKKTTMSLVPKLICKDPRGQVTHEASIGKISEEELNYLRTRGLKEEEAVDLIVSGFLKS